MAQKKFCLGMLLMALAFTMTLAGCVKKPVDESKTDVPAWLKDNPPEDALWGTGVAQTESDGESILLAEDRARTEIARQLDSKIYSIIAEDQEGTRSANFTQMTTSTIITGSQVIRRYKSKNGAWWCLVELPKENALLSNALLSGIKPARIDSVATFQSDIEIFRSNMENWPDIKNAVTLDGIPGWVFENGPEDVFCGVGAAKLGSNEETVYLAMERARRSLARSLSVETNAVFSDYYVSESESYAEDGVAITSVYEYTPMRTQLLNLAKTKDGTLWVMLGTVVTVSFDAEERMNRAFERLAEETQQ